MTPVVSHLYHPSLIPTHVVRVTKITKARVTFAPVSTEGEPVSLPMSMRRADFERTYVEVK